MPASSSLTIDVPAQGAGVGGGQRSRAASTAARRARAQSKAQSTSTSTAPAGGAPPENTIAVNDFFFCAEHGSEYCHTCCCDHRLVNNLRIEDELYGGDAADDTGHYDEGCSSFEFESDLETRHSINAFALGAQPNLLTPHSFQCEAHRVNDCKQCFNWVEIVKKGVEAAASEFGEGLRWGLGPESARKEGNVLQQALENLDMGERKS